MRVAYTHHQPRTTDVADQDDNDQSGDTETTSSLLLLNDDCLFAVFDLCDNYSLVNLSETCTRFNILLASSYNFPNNKVFRLYRFDGHLMSLAFIRKILRLMGSNFQTLDLYFLGMYDDQVHCCLKSVIRHCKTNTIIRELKITIEHWNRDFSSLIGAIFENLQKLDLFITQNEVSLPDLPALCLNLKQITTTQFSKECSVTTRPNLESYSYESYSHELINSPRMLEFFSNNPQIKIFKCSDFSSQDLPSLADHLPNIQKLSLNVYEVSSSNDFVSFKSFKHLTKLKLRFIPFGFEEMPEINLRQTIECFRDFNGLLELKLHFRQRNNLPAHVIQKSIIQLSKMLPNLERFDLIGFKLVESTVVDFVRFAGKLKSLHFHICNVHATESLITKLVSVRKSRKEKLNLFLDDEDRNSAVTFNGTYLNVEWDCYHDLRFVKDRK